jgi:hypothetical protein
MVAVDALVEGRSIDPIGAESHGFSKVINVQNVNNVRPADPA